MMVKFLITFLSLLVSTVCFTQPTLSLWQELSRSFKLPDQSNHPLVKNQIRWLILHPTYIKEFADNSEPYIYFILEEIKKQRLPGELALLPMIESNYNPFAYSHAGAAGLWQLMPGTGSGLGVTQDWWYDGRRGIITSTTAALGYLSYLNRFFKGNWMHAIAAYDSGEGTVQRAVQRNQQLRLSTDFWSLALPQETKAYVPRLLAMASLIKYPRYFGIKLPEKPYRPYFEEVRIPNQIDLNHAAKLAGVSYEELLKLNPGHNRWTTAPTARSSLLLPLKKVAAFIQRLTEVPKAQFVSWRRYRVKAGDTLGQIALAQHSKVALIQKVNKLKNHVIKPGQSLIIPKTHMLAPPTLLAAQKQLVVKKTHQGGPHRVIHVVQAGDTLSSIGQKYYVKAQEILFWNQMRNERSLKVGDKLLIWQTKKNKNKRMYVVVKAGDTLSHIAHKYHVSLEKLRKLNRLDVKQVIKPMQRLKLS